MRPVLYKARNHVRRRNNTRIGSLGCMAIPLAKRSLAVQLDALPEKGNDAPGCS